MKRNNSYESCMFSQMKWIFAMWFLHILQGQASGFHTLISFLLELHSNSWNLTFINKLQFAVILGFFTVKVSKNW